MRTVLNDDFRPFHRTLSAQIGNTLFGNDDIDGMFTMILMRNHRYNGTDTTSFCRRRTGENRNIGTPGEISGTADTVHHLRTADMS